MTLTTQQRDPTRTIGLRNRYRADVVRRWRQVLRDLLISIVDLDVLGLTDLEQFETEQAADPERFIFKTNPAKAAEFITYLGELVDDVVLEITQREGRTIVAHEAWQNVYIQSSYSSGILAADAKLAAEGVQVGRTVLSAVFNAPRHADALGILFTRNFEFLVGQTERTAVAIRETLVRGMAEGIGPREMGRRVAANVQNISINHGTVLARTEVINAHAASTLNRFADFAVPGVTAEVEFITAGDDRVCVVCEGLEGDIFTLDNAAGIIPVHAQCRCSWLPVVEEPLSVGPARTVFEGFSVGGVKFPTPEAA